MLGYYRSSLTGLGNDIALRRWTVLLLWLTNPHAMVGPAKIYFLVFGVLSIAGGVMGYVKAGSTVSLIAGGISGILLILAGYFLPEHLIRGLGIGLVVSLLLFLQFLPRFLRTRRVMPAGLMLLLSIGGIAMALAAWFKT